eukprot:36899-Eustigmatos_ZCMA.PRE.1
MSSLTTTTTMATSTTATTSTEIYCKNQNVTTNTEMTTAMVTLKVCIQLSQQSLDNLQETYVCA